MRHEPARRRRRIRAGVTLLELIVVISLMGLVLAIAAPSFIAPAPERKSELTSVLETARRSASLRGEPVTLSVDDAGAWRIDGDATPTASPIGAGTLGSRIGAFRVRVSPLGTCVSDVARAPSLGDWNVVDCRLERANTTEAAR
jgi:prepilin-type N-terminal cleavage/methylation domain-containing protein